MTELLNQDRLRLIALVMDHPFLQPRPQVPTLRRALDSESGRPVAYWVLKDAPEKPAQP